MRRVLVSLGVVVAVGVWLPAGAVAEPGPGPGGGVVVTPSDPGGKYGPPAVYVGVGTTGRQGRPGARGVAQDAARGDGSACSYSAAPEMETWSRGLPSRVFPGGRDQVDATSHLYARVCDGQPVTYVWLTAAQQAAAVPSPEELARRAYRQLVLPVPVIQTSPAVGVPQLVRVPTWLWIAPGVWAERSATATVPGLSATATARPVAVRWTTGDGSSVTCRGPGTAFRPRVDRPAAESPDCAHTYLRSSAGQPDGVFQVTAVVEWSVSWAGGGQAGVLPALTSTSSVALRVTESQALNDR